MSPSKIAYTMWIFNAISLVVLVFAEAWASNTGHWTGPALHLLLFGACIAKVVLSVWALMSLYNTDDELRTHAKNL